MILSEMKKHKKTIACVAVVAVLLGGGLYFYLHHEKVAQEAPKVMKYQDTTNSGKLKNTLDVDDNTAGQLVKEIEYIYDGKVAPETTYYVTAPNLEKAADDTASNIKTTMATGKNTNNLPTAAVEKTDRTVVTANTDQQQVDVYKINLRNNHKLKGGVLYHDNGLSVGAGYQAGKWEGMVYVGHGKPDYAVNYTWKEW
ncbi:hypothetical protein [Megasphaera sueciensis]|uniref:hypothetical protein n=1 Tax=Megasphaera sueciensis TaxID=349094 RepID=UPI003D069994